MKSVPKSDVPQNPFLWSRGTAARETLRYLDRNGIDAELLLLRRSFRAVCCRRIQTAYPSRRSFGS
jgi:hypothetical protein